MESEISKSFKELKIKSLLIWVWIGPSSSLLRRIDCSCKAFLNKVFLDLFEISQFFEVDLLTVNSSV